MITAGIDCGAKNVKAVILADGEAAGRAMAPAGIDAAAAAAAVVEGALADAGLARDDVLRVVSTGVGKGDLGFPARTITEVGAAARGMHQLDPAVLTVIDVGAEEARAVRIDATGKVLDFAINEKCASGTGSFAEAMARALEVPLEELGPLALESTNPIPINAQCAVFAESEVISMVHRQVPAPDMARAILDAVADRITAMVRRVGATPEVALIGGVARNVGFVRALAEDLELEVRVPDHPEYVCAMGAAWAATDG